MDRGVDAHRHLVRVFSSDAVVHLEEVSVALFDHVGTDAARRFGEVEARAVLQRAYTATGVDLVLDRAGGDVARNEVSEGRVAPFEEVVAVVFGNLIRRATVVHLLRY